jgi:ABC-type transport system involved in cytochrome bd biosynthesis fused ATPase/permease subunit
MLAGASPSALAAALGFGGLGLLRVALTTLAEAQAHIAADAILARARTEIVINEARRATDSASGGAGSLAALAGEKLDLLAPYVSRYAPARARVMVLPLVILGLAFWQSWAVGVVLLISGPLIPVFMALVGMAAKEASARQMAEMSRVIGRTEDEKYYTILASDLKKAFNEFHFDEKEGCYYSTNHCRAQSKQRQSQWPEHSKPALWLAR